MKKLKLDDDIPLERAAYRSHAKYPFREMRVGQSFFVPKRKKLNGSINYAQLKWGIKLKTRIEPDGLRIWRTA